MQAFNRRMWALAVAGLAITAGLAVAQTTVIQGGLSGNEVVRAAQGPGGPEAWLAVRTIAGGGITTQSGSGAATATGAGGTLCWKGTAPTTWAVTLPSGPAHGTIQKLCSDTTLTTLVTVTAGTGDTLTTTFGSQTITANASFPAWQYNSTDRVWYRIQ